ncbi:Transposase [Vibrio aquimaris]|uniref:Uncharacterized protein n=1 Tax=Vibrio aquimaris TaxID=2587862 RepID=A0A5P9CHI9_9VIBR|nr:hypothetical protein FIV01_04800 [Vibrio aquimaris]
MYQKREELLYCLRFYRLRKGFLDYLSQGNKSRGKKKASRKCLLAILVNTLFTNNVSWLGDP